MAGRSIDGRCPDVSGAYGAMLSEMTTFDDREKAFEAKYALDQEQEFKAIARLLEIGAHDGDFKASGLSVSEGEIRSKIDELASIAREQIRAGE